MSYPERTNGPRSVYSCDEAVMRATNVLQQMGGINIAVKCRDGLEGSPRRWSYSPLTFTISFDVTKIEREEKFVLTAQGEKEMCDLSVSFVETFFPHFPHLKVAGKKRSCVDTNWHWYFIFRNL